MFLCLISPCLLCFCLFVLWCCLFWGGGVRCLVVFRLVCFVCILLFCFVSETLFCSVLFWCVVFGSCLVCFLYFWVSCFACLLCGFLCLCVLLANACLFVWVWFLVSCDFILGGGLAQPPRGFPRTTALNEGGCPCVVRMYMHIYIYSTCTYVIW